MYRRVFFVGVLPLLTPNAARAGVIGVIVSFLGACIFRELEPYARRSTNTIQLFCQYTLVLSYGMVVVVGSDITSKLRPTRLGYMLLVTQLFFFAAVAAIFVIRTRADFRKADKATRALCWLEDATGFSRDKFATTFDAIEQNSVSASCCLVFWYASISDVRKALASGIPALARHDGVLLTLHRPHDLDETDKAAFPCREALLLCAMPRSLLVHFVSGDSVVDGNAKTIVHSEDNPCFLRLIPGNLLRALRPTSFSRIHDPTPWHDHDGIPGSILLPPQQIVRAFQLEEIKTSKPSVVTVSSSVYLKDVRGPRPSHYSELYKEPQTCLDFIRRMTEIRQKCDMFGWVPMYHYTQPFLGRRIFETGFRMSTVGQGILVYACLAGSAQTSAPSFVGDGGVYFSMNGPTSYYLGSSIYEERLIEDCFGRARVDEYRGMHKLDLVIVYGVEPLALSQAPGGRDNAKVVSKFDFESFSVAHMDGNFFLRPDRILGVFLIDPTKPPGGFEEAREARRLERAKDTAVKEALARAQAEINKHEHEVHDLLRMYGNKKEGVAGEEESEELRARRPSTEVFRALIGNDDSFNSVEQMHSSTTVTHIEAPHAVTRHGDPDSAQLRPGFLSRAQGWLGRNLTKGTRPQRTPEPVVELEMQHDQVAGYFADNPLATSKTRL